MKTKGKFRQLSVSRGYCGPIVVAVCDSGDAWILISPVRKTDRSAYWKPLPPLPPLQPKPPTPTRKEHHASTQ